MTGVSIRATIRDGELLAALQGLVGRMERPEGFYRNVGEHMLRSTRRNFEQEQAPDGRQWAPLRPSTVRKRGAKGPILTLKGDLRGSVSYAATPEGVTIGTGAIYAAIHQLGGRIEREGAIREVRFRVDRRGERLRDGRGLLRFAGRRQRAASELAVVRPYAIDIPARPFLGVSADDERAILAIAARWLATDD